MTEQQLGANHPDTANSLNNLAALYKSMGRYEEALPLYERAIALGFTFHPPRVRVYPQRGQGRSPPGSTFIPQSSGWIPKGFKGDRPEVQLSSPKAQV
ncbi:MAG: tetratricopeptide repeat protein [Oscillatoriales cyanobacterium SM2_1_8]|nr:tetratricopeptide repeat protein [Oscillatoriales cyanobacterium SM2_1_8]